VAFGFGLVHGFGFASVLADLGLPRDALVLALVGFNIGVELGQLAIVVLFLPSAYALRRTPLYRRWVMVGASLLIALLAAVWLVERAAGVQVLGVLGASNGHYLPFANTRAAGTSRSAESANATQGAREYS